MAFEAVLAPPAALPKQAEQAPSPVAPKTAEQGSGIRGRVDSFFKSREAKAPAVSDVSNIPDGILGIKTDSPAEVANIQAFDSAKDSREVAFAARDNRLAREKAMQNTLDDTALAKSYLEQVIDRESKSNGGVGNSIDRHYAGIRVHEAYREKAKNSPEVVAAMNSGNQDEIEDAINRTINNTLTAEAKADLANKIASQNSATAGLDELAQASVTEPVSEAVPNPEADQALGGEIQEATKTSDSPEEPAMNPDQQIIESPAQGEQEKPAEATSETPPSAVGEEPEEPLSEAATEIPLADSLDDDPRYKALLQEASLTYLQTDDAEWFSSRFPNSDRDEQGYLTDKDGHKFLPYQNIGGGQPMQDVLDKAKAEFERLYPDDAKKYAEKLAAKAPSDEAKPDSAGDEAGDAIAGQTEDSSNQAGNASQTEEAREHETAESPQVQELRSEITSLQETLKLTNETLANVNKEIASLKDANGKLVQAVEQVMLAQDADPELRKKILKNVAAMLAAIVATMGISAVGVGKQVITPS